MDPLTLSLLLASIGGGIGAMTNKKHPIKGGLIGAGLGAAGGAGLGALGAGAAGAGAAGAGASTAGAGAASSGAAGAGGGGMAGLGSFLTKAAPFAKMLGGQQQDANQLPPVMPQPQMMQVNPSVSAAPSQQMVPQIAGMRQRYPFMGGGYAG